MHGPSSRLGLGGHAAECEHIPRAAHGQDGVDLVGAVIKSFRGRERRGPPFPQTLPYRLEQIFRSDRIDQAGQGRARKDQAFRAQDTALDDPVTAEGFQGEMTIHAQPGSGCRYRVVAAEQLLREVGAFELLRPGQSAQE